MENKSKSRNKFIDIYKYICAVLVVIIHTHLFEDVNFYLGYIVVNVLTRIAVPTFFCITGYFFFLKLREKRINIFKFLKKYVFLYLLLTLVYIPIKIIENGWSIKILTDIFFVGSFGHLWYFPAIIICITICYCVYKIRLIKPFIILNIFLYVIGCLCCSYFYLFNDIPIIKELVSFKHFETIRRIFLMSMPFFTMGYLVLYFKDKIKNINFSICLFVTNLLIFLFFFEIAIVNAFSFNRSVLLTLFLYPLVFILFYLSLNAKLKNNKENSFVHNFKNASEVTYFFHPIAIRILKFIFSIFSLNISESILFIFTIIICWIFLFIFNFINKKIKKE